MWNSLFVAVLGGDVAAAAALLAQGGLDLEAADEGGWTPLMVAAVQADVAMMELLLSLLAND